MPDPQEIARIVDRAVEIAVAEGIRLLRHDPLAVRRLLAEAVIRKLRERQAPA